MAISINFQPQDYFNTKLYTGNGSTNAITGVGFQPDMGMVEKQKCTNDHASYDAVRGANKVINQILLLHKTNQLVT